MASPARVERLPATYHPSPRVAQAVGPPLKALTGLRFVAAVWVVLFHVVGHPATTAGYRLISRGYVGVSLFFVLSGFILAYTYLDPGTGELRGTLRAFVWARVARIYPVYALALLLALPFYIIELGGTHRAGAWVATILAPTLLQAWVPAAACPWNCPGWSLSAEAFFYALFPFVGVWLVRHPRRALPLALAFWAVLRAVPIAFLLAGLGTDVDSAARDALFYLPLVHVSDFLLGVATGVAFVRGMLPQRRIRASAAIAGVLLVGVLALVPNIPAAFLRTGIFAPGFALLIVALARVPLRAGWFVRLGEASYALYLVHVPVHEYVMRAAPPVLGLAHRTVASPHVWSALVAVQVAASIALSLAIFAWVEEPARRRVRALLMRPAI